MKRKNPEFAKARRFIRKTKFSENLSSTSYLYIKLFLLWFLVVISDFLIEFRFEYLWPFYLCVRNVYDIFKYQGIAFSAFFVFITLTSNAICFFLMPVQWLFFIASTYVWFQYIWNSEKGICLQTFTVWLIFVYVEATVRIKELKSMPNHLDLCKPMAAQCISYPFVTMGFGFKKYLNYKILSRRRKEVETENELTFNIVNRLHIENINSESLISNHNNSSINHLNNNNEITNEESTNEQNFDQESEDERRISNVDVDAIQIGSSSNLVLIIENIFILMTTYLIAIFRKFLNLTNLNHRFRLLTKSSSDSNSSLIDNNKALDNKILDRLIDKSTDKSTEQISSSIQDNNNSSFLQEEIVTLTPTNCLSSIDQNQQDNNNDTVRSLDKLKKMKQENKNEIKKLKNELQSIKQSELDCKEKLNKMQVSRNEFKFQCNKLQHDNTVLQEKLQNCLNSKQQDKNMINELEKKLQEERKTKQQLEKQVNKYSKVIECGEACKQRRQEFDDCLNQLREELKLKDIQMNKLKEDAFGNKSLLLNALEKMQNRNSQLESNLREETKLKLELFSVLGDTRRQLEVNQLILFQKSNEVEELNCKLSELMAVMPSINTHSDPYGSIFLPNFMNQTVNSAINQTLNLNQNVNQNETVNMVNVTASSSTLNNLNSNLNSNLNNNNIGISKHQSPSSTEYQQSNVRNTVLKNSIVGSRDNLSHKTNLINTSNNNSNNVSTNSNRTSSSSSSIKDASIDWKNLTNSLEHSLESTSGVSSTPKSSNSDL